MSDLAGLPRREPGRFGHQEWLSGQIYQLTFDGAPPEDWGAEDLDALHEFMDGRVQFDTPEQRPPRRQDAGRQGTNGQDRGRLSAKSSAAERWSR